jgi:hypothetical protein
MTTLLSIRQAADQGIQYLRRPLWIHPCAHLKIDLFDGHLGPWVHLYDPCNKLCNGLDPVDVLILQFDLHAQEWLKHEGPVTGSQEYQDAVDQHAALAIAIGTTG